MSPIQKCPGRAVLGAAVVITCCQAEVERIALCYLCLCRRRRRRYGTDCSRRGSARNGLQVRMSIGTQCSRQQRQRYSYSTAGTLCYFVAALQDLPPFFFLSPHSLYTHFSLPPVKSLFYSVSPPWFPPVVPSPSLHWRVTLAGTARVKTGRGGITIYIYIYLKTNKKKTPPKNREEGKVAFHGERVGRTLSTRPGCVMRRTALISRPEATEQDERPGAQRGQRRQCEGEATVTDLGRAGKSVSVFIYTQHPASFYSLFF